MISFVVEGNPAPKGSMRAVRVGKRKQKTVVLHDNERTRPWADAISWHARQHMAKERIPVCEGAVMLRLHFYLPRPKSVTRAAPTVKPDVDKLIRTVLDALTGILWVDDAQVTSVHGNKEYADPPGEGMAPGVHVIAIDLKRANEQAEAISGT